MPRSQDPTQAIRKKAAALPDVVEGTSCNQTSYKVKKGPFLFLGPGPKGIGFKAMFKLQPSRDQAMTLAADRPDRFEVGSGKWVTTRFTAEEPLPKSIWEKWLDESYRLTSKP